MITTRTLHYRSAVGMIQGLRKLFEEGLRPRDVMFLALDGHGDVNLVVPARTRDVQRVRVGEKLSIPDPLEPPAYHVDAVHPLAGADLVVINGDRRIGKLNSMVDVASLSTWFIQEAGDESMFFGCTPHQPGSWWVREEESVSLHSRGFVEIVSTAAGLLARRIMDDGLYFLEREHAALGHLDRWVRVFTSPLGNVLMLERRALYDQLVMSCQGGLVEVDLYDLPRAHESGRFSLPAGHAVVGRISGGAFAVARGEPMDWGFENLQPATLVGSEGCSFGELRELLRSAG